MTRATNGEQRPVDDGSADRRAASAAPPFLVAGVGASAGGLEAFLLMLSSIPADAPLALVLVQHLARDHESLLAEVVASKTKLATIQARDGQLIEPGHVYVIPPATYMTVVDGHLHVEARPSGPAGSGAVDFFFESVAEQYREKAIGVILSGSGRDGSSGVREIHAAGGLTFVQEPAEAKIDGMPRAAIMTGVVGKVLPAKDISAELVRLSHDAFFLQPVADNQPEWEGLSPTAVDEQSVLRSIFTVLLQVTGVDFGQYKLPTIRRRIRRRMALHRLSDLGEYLAVLQKNPAEAEDLHDDILIHVTEFFREPEAFSVLADVALPALLAERPPSVPIRAWVPACSSGEEGYSLAVTLLQYLEMRGEARPIQVFATDVSERMIDRARAGVYPNTIESQVSSEQLRRFFVKVDSGYRVASSVRECCVFARQDATRDPPFSKMDIVLCRNLLIYLGVGVQRKLVSVFHYALNPNGFLVLGRSETIGTYPDLFTPVDNRARIYRRKPGASTFRGAIDFPGRETAPAPPVSVPQADHPASGATNERSEMPADVKQILIDRFAPPSMILDQDFRALRFHGDVSPYLALPVGEVVFDAVRMARPRLSTALAAILHDARRRGTAARKKGVPLQSGGKRRDIDLEAIPVGRPESRQYLVVFRDANRPGNGNRSGEKDLARVDQTRSRVRGVRAVAELEEELADTKEQMSAIVQDLGAANEELQSANEEILSSNEELQSTNEELDTAREELQSTNEELSTLNDELQTRNSELSRANGDLLNVIANTQIAVVIVSHSGTIRHVTPAAARVLNVMASDVGRPIGHIKPAVRDADLDQMIKEVSASASVVERQVEDGERNTYILRGCPYKDVDNRINGVVLALFDVSSALETSRRIGEAIIARVNDPILLLDSDRRVRRANRAFCEMFHVSPTETEGRLVFDLGRGQWNIPALRELLQHVLPERQNFDGFTVEHDFPVIGRKRIVLSGERIGSEHTDVGVILLVMRDVTHVET